MEPATLAVAVATLFFSEALKKTGETLGKGVSDLATKLIHTVRGKFKESSTEGLLNRAENNPTPQNIKTVQNELTTQMEDDKSYGAQLQDLVNQLESTGVVHQDIARGIEVKTLKMGAMTQTAPRGAYVEQHMLTDVKANNIEIDDIIQKT
jgi:hypothetical protein